ncbi:hypothetical protein EJ08DRAFT_31291 [Tothia fuscella]|uniref:Uncharacterized protein n=1 Tax=Tothia fuscella TaxID=1048955 RepID=A0A9P4NFY3_9PEZI|nr:hypothetical protein EJ08DRAFT_31291 [Tothia fuscella]
MCKFKFFSSLLSVQLGTKLPAKRPPAKKKRIVRSLCIRDAVMGRLNNQISEKEYLQCIVDHATGARHGVNRLCNGDDSEGAYLVSNVSQDLDPFASRVVSEWISRMLGHIEDTAPLHTTLKAYRSRNAKEFKAGIQEMDRVYGTSYHSSTLYKRALAMHALLLRDATMLKAVLDELFDDIDWPFHEEYNRIKYRWNEQKIARVVRKSIFKSIVPRGKRFRDLHAMEYMT